MPRAKTIRNDKPTTDTAPAEDSRRPLEWYESRLEDAEGVSYIRTRKYRESRDAFDALLARFEDRGKVFQLLERMLPAYGRMIAATDDEADKRAQRDRRAAEIADNTPDEIGQQNANGGLTPEESALVTANTVATSNG